METKQEIFERYLDEYFKASKKEKNAMLNHICNVIQIQRKAVIRRMGILQTRDPAWKDRRGRRVHYTPYVTSALKEVWQASSELCGELLRPIIPEYVAIFKRDRTWNHGQEATCKLLLISEATMKRRIAGFIKAREPRGVSSAKPSLLKAIIPVFMGPWHDKGPGYGQIDSVVHCGSSLLGDMIYTINYTDIATRWVIPCAQYNKEQHVTIKSMNIIKERLPFRLRGLHPDSGSEFINWLAKNWCDKKHIELTRSRPYHKNDNAYVEQKNGHVIRRFLGYQRLDDPSLVFLPNEYYEKLETYVNHFVPTKVCVKKERIGSRYKRHYDKAQAPYQRTLLHHGISQETKQALKETHTTLNPLALQRKLDVLRAHIFTQQKQYDNTKYQF
jgi:hypothetical protein